MIQLCYISTVRPNTDPSEVDQILRVSRRNNAQSRVTGLLLFNGKRFLQVLEGVPAEVEAVYARVLKDPRHFAVVKLSERKIEEREFGSWDMDFERVDGAVGKAALIDRVKGLTSAANPSVKALFTSYAAI
jgi:hypothetical protein